MLCLPDGRLGVMLLRPDPLRLFGLGAVQARLGAPNFDLASIAAVLYDYVSWTQSAASGQ